MRQRHAWHIPAKHSAKLGGTIPCRVNHIFTANFASRCGQYPLAIFPAHRCHRTKTDDFLSLVTGAFCQSLSQLRRINISIERIPLAAIEIMRFKEWMNVLHFLVRHLNKFNAHLPSHTFDMAELFHALARMCQTNCAGHMVVHRIVDKFAKLAIQACRIGLHFHDRPRANIIRAIACRVPC